MTNTRMYWLHTLSPTHVGTGRGVGYIDLPIHRDKVTGWPVIPGSAFKGVWRDWAEHQKLANVDAAFGKATVDKESNAGALVPTDARIVCLPIRSFQGTFAWCTSALVLEMLRRDLTLAGLPTPPALKLPNDETAYVADSAVLKEGNRVYLEDLDFAAVTHPSAQQWAEKIAAWVFPGQDDPWREVFQQRFAVLSDSVFNFLTETGTEVTARVKIDDDTKIVAGGALWNEEALPAETILAGLVSCDRLYGKTNGSSEKDLLRDFATAPLNLQIGGKATVGRGRVRCVFTPENGGGA